MRTTLAAAIIVALSASVVQADPLFEGARMRMCNGSPNTPTKTCVVDGDTVWYRGSSYRLESFDTPEPQTNICGGRAEVELARRASARLLNLLNSNRWTLEDRGDDGGYGRRLGTIRINGRDVGDILIAEGLARRWPNGREFWC